MKEDSGIEIHRHPVPLQLLPIILPTTQLNYICNPSHLLMATIPSPTSSSRPAPNLPLVVLVVSNSSYCGVSCKNLNQELADFESCLDFKITVMT
jgi:hypothetical protein